MQATNTFNVILDACSIRSQRQRYLAKQVASNQYTATFIAYIDSFKGSTGDRSMREYVRRARNHLKATGTDTLATRTRDSLRNELAATKWEMYRNWLFTEKGNLLASKALEGKLASVEIECLFNSKADAVAAISYWKANNVQVTGKTDGSIRCLNDNQIPIELVFTMPIGEYATLAAVCHGLAGRATVNKSCGLHVHFDRRHSDYVTTKNVAKMLAGYVPALKRMLPESRRNNQYCKYSHNESDRYSFINSKAYTRHGTLEIRGHSGTIDYTKIANWVDIMYKLIAIAEQPAQRYKQVRSVATLLKVLRAAGTGMGLLEYIKERAALFSGSNVHNEEPEYTIAA
jgi:hypothetical protein